MTPLPTWATALLPWAALAAALMTALMASLVLAQGKLLFGRTWRVRRTQPGPAAADRRTAAVSLARPGGAQLAGWLTVPTRQAPQRLVLWLGGRNEHVAWTPDLAGWLPDDCALLAFNYRSLGGSTGWPGEAACVADAQAAADWGLAHLALPPDALHLAGRSLGTGVAMQLAARRAAAGQTPASLVLLTPFASLRALLARRPLLWPVLPLLRSPLDSLSAARQLRCPVLMLLAERDAQVPHGHALQLAAALQAAGCTVSLETQPGTNHRSLARTVPAMTRVGTWLTGPA